MKEFVIEQLEKHLFTVIYVSEETLTKDNKRTIANEMERYLEKGLTITFERQDQLKRSNSGKLKQFTSYVTSRS